MWRERLGEGSLIGVGDSLAVWTQGSLRLVAADRSGYRERAVIPLSEVPERTVIPPAFSEGTVFIRHPTEIIAVQILAG